MVKNNQQDSLVRKATSPLAGGRAVVGEPSQSSASPRTVWDDGELVGTPRNQETTRQSSRLANAQRVNPPPNAPESNEGGSMARRRGFVPHPGMSKRSGRQPQTTIIDVDFDRSKLSFGKPDGTGETGAVEVKPWQKRLFDPAVPMHGDLLNRPDSIPRESPQNKSNQSGWRGKITGRDASGPQHRPMAQGSREGGKIMILNNPATSQRLPHYGSHEPQESSRMFAGPETRPISIEHLIAEVKGIYAGLVMVEAKCCEVDAKQAKDQDGKYPHLSNEQWQALNSLHRTLLNEHHDFFLASQHPIATPALRKLAVTYSMPTRMWRHGIQSYLELLRHRLPHSMEHMLAFLYLSYSILTLLYETVPEFADTWIESLGDLGRYRMAIEDDDIYDREVWAKTARFWYSKAAEKTPGVGRLYHHLAILARPNLLFQFFYYCKSLGASQPFLPSRETVLIVFDSILDDIAPRAPPVVAEYIQLHEINFTHTGLERFDDCLVKFLRILSTHLSHPMSRWKGPGSYVAVCNITGLYQYGAKDSLFHQSLSQRTHVVDVEMGDVPALDESGGILPSLPTQTPTGKVTSPLFHLISGTSGTDQSAHGLAARVRSFNNSKRLSYDVLDLALKKIGNDDVLPHVHIWLVFMMHITTSESATRLLENTFPWESLVLLLNFLLKSFDSDRFECEDFPVPEKGIARPLPEDFLIQGLDWSRLYYPDGWIKKANVDEGDQAIELPSMASARVERILWLATRIAASGNRLVLKNRRFFVHPSLHQRMQQPMVEQSEEVRFLNQQYQHRSQFNTEPVKTTMTKGPEILQPRYTVFVIDTNLLLSHLETFRLIISTNDWSVIIPRCVLDELLDLTSNPGVEGDAAKAAIIAVSGAVDGKRDVTVVATNGNIAMNIGFNNLRRNPLNESSNINDIIQTTQHQGVVRRGMLGNSGEAEAAVLITEDVSMRAKAHRRGVTAMATSIVHRYLSRPDACARSKRKSFEHPVTNLQQRYPQLEGEDIECTPSESNGNLHGAIEQMEIGGGKKRQRTLGNDS